jgi:hypothetical protein
MLGNRYIMLSFSLFLDPDTDPGELNQCRSMWAQIQMRNRASYVIYNFFKFEFFSLLTDGGGVCPSCRVAFNEGKRRRLVDACGHERCYSCLFQSETCPLCLPSKSIPKPLFRINDILVWIRMRIQVLLFLSLTLKTPTKN